jgi:hypothetical protein
MGHHLVSQLRGLVKLHSAPDSAVDLFDSNVDVDLKWGGYHIAPK